MQIPEKQNISKISQSTTEGINIYSSGATYALFFFTFAYLIVTYFHLQANLTPPRWDDSLYLAQSEIMFSAIQGNDTHSFINYGIEKESEHYLLSLFSTLTGVHAPLIVLLPIPSYFILGTGFPAITATYMLLIIFFVLALYSFVLYLTDDAWVAFLAVAITSTMPLTAGLSRMFLVEYGLTILVVLWMYLQVRMDHFRDRRFSVPLGIVLGLGMLMKLTFPIYIFGSVLWGLLSVVRAGNINKKKVINLVLNFLIILLVAWFIMSPWYMKNINYVISFGLYAGFGSASKYYSLGNVFDLTTLLKYWLAFINTVMTFYYFVALLGLLIIQTIKYFVEGKQESPKNVIESKNVNIAMMIICFLIPFFVFSFTTNKDLRFLLPTLPSLGVIMAEIIIKATKGIKKGSLRLITMFLILAFPFYLFCFTSLPLSSTYNLNAGPFLIIAPNVGYAVRPISQTWPLEQILTVIKQDAQRNNIKTSMRSPLPVGIIPNHVYFNPNTFTYYSIHKNLEFAFAHFIPAATGNIGSEMDKLLSMQYIITKTEDLGPDFAYNPNINPMLMNGELPFVEIDRFPLPDGSEALIFRRK
jgi:hypothetical protein